MILHIFRPSGFYIGQVRQRGRQTWETVTGKCRAPENAMAKAVMAMRPNDKRARVLFIDRSGWYSPHVVMETSR